MPDDISNSVFELRLQDGRRVSVSFPDVSGNVIDENNTDRESLADLFERWAASIRDGRARVQEYHPFLGTSHI